MISDSAPRATAPTPSVPSWFTLRGFPERLELLDQRQLPQHELYLNCRSAQEVAEAIATMAVRGAPAIGLAAAYGIALEAQALAADHERSPATPQLFAAALEQGFATLTTSRPTAVNLCWALAHQRRIWNELAPVLTSPARLELARHLFETAQRLEREDVQANRRLGEWGAGLLPATARILTHCNAGALATGGHGTALGIIRSAWAAGKHIRVWADETRPLLQGARLTAWELQRDGIPVTLICDNMAGWLMQRGEVDAVIVGADRVAANGDVANKIGTYMVAVLARRHRIPFYVAFPLSTLDLNCPNGAAIPIEERDGAEVTGWAGHSWAAPGVAVFNPAFDVTPAELVSAWISEAGVVSGSQPAALLTMTP